MKINSFPSVAFQKKLIAKCDTMKSGLYELERQKDCDYFKQLLFDKNWNQNSFVEDFDYFINNLATRNNKIFVMEDENDRCLCVSQVDSMCYNADFLNYIETNPSDCYGRGEKRKKYIGETMLAFLIKLAKGTEKPCFVISRPDESALEFYEKCGFEQKLKLQMNEEFYDKFIQQNVAHVGEIEVLK